MADQCGEESLALALHPEGVDQPRLVEETEIDALAHGLS